MSAPRILTVIGTRPEAIKMAPVIRALSRRSEVEHRLVLTGQHTDLVDQILDVFQVKSDYDLDLMKPDQTPYDVAHACLDGLRDVSNDFKPDVTVVQGDTATVFFSGLVAFLEKGGLAHVEAGLRSHEKWAPFPEEMLRRMTDTLSDFCFAPTPGAARNLRAEGVPADRIFVTGNTVVDALREVASAGVPISNPTLADLLKTGRRLVLLTAHRRESFGEPMRRLFKAIVELSTRNPDVDILYPVHPNPNVRNPASEILGGHAGIHLIDPLTYTDLVAVLEGAALVLTDSGGIQEEAPTFGTPVLVLRTVTERPEGIESGVATLVGTDPDRILAAAATYLEAEPPRGLRRSGNPYGDGRAGERIADILTAHLSGTTRRLEDWAGAAGT